MPRLDLLNRHWIFAPSGLVSYPQGLEKLWSRAPQEVFRDVLIRSNVQMRLYSARLNNRLDGLWRADPHRGRNLQRDYRRGGLGNLRSRRRLGKCPSAVILNENVYSEAIKPNANTCHAAIVQGAKNCREDIAGPGQFQVVSAPKAGRDIHPHPGSARDAHAVVRLLATDGDYERALSDPLNSTAEQSARNFGFGCIDWNAALRQVAQRLLRRHHVSVFLIRDRLSHRTKGSGAYRVMSNGAPTN